jgi:hypothetical protein
VVEYLRLRNVLSPEIEKTIKQEALRMASLIRDRVKRGGDLSVKINPLRTAPNVSDLVAANISRTLSGAKDIDPKISVIPRKMGERSHVKTYPAPLSAIPTPIDLRPDPPW